MKKAFGVLNRLGGGGGMVVTRGDKLKLKTKSMNTQIKVKTASPRLI